MSKTRILDPSTEELIVSTELNATVLRSIMPVASALGILYVFFAASHLLLLPADIRWHMAGLAAATAITLLYLAHRLRRRTVPIGHAHRIAVGVGLLVYINTTVHLWLNHAPLQMTNLMLLLMGTAFFLLSTPWFIAFAGLVTGTWIVGIITLSPPEAQVHYTFALISTNITAALVHRERRHAIERLERLRLHDEHQRAQLQVTLQTLQRSEENYRDLAENASDLIQSVRPDGTFQYVNRAWLSTLGYTPDDVAQISAFDVIHPRDHEHCRAIFGQLREEACTQRIEATFLTADGREVLVEGNVNCTMQRGQPDYTRGIFRDITTRKQMEYLLRQERDFTTAIINTTSTLISVLDPDGRIVRYNRACEQLTGTRLDDIQGRHFWSLFEPPDEMNAVRSAFLNTKATQFSTSYEGHWTNTRGERRLIEWSNTSLQNEDGSIKNIIASGIDRTLRREAQREVVKRRSYLESVLAAAPDAIITLDTEHHILEWNVGAERLFGYQRNEVVGQYIDPLITNRESHEEAISLTQKAAHGHEILPLETVRYRKDGTPVNVILAASPIWIEDDLVGVAAVYTDITALKQAEEDLRQRNADLDAFSHTVAHDLKGPLSNIFGYASLLQEEIPPTVNTMLSEGIDAITRSTQRMVNIIDALLLLAGLRGAQVKAEIVDMGSVVDEVLQRLAYMTVQYNAQMIRPEQWPEAVGYGPWIEEIWANYISNALKYGGTPPIVELGAETLPDGMVRFWVRDNGQGMTEEQQSQLFTPFTRLSQVRVEGHGLGLSIVRRITDRLGGRAGASPAPHQGSEFYFCLPAPARKGSSL